MRPWILIFILATGVLGCAEGEQTEACQQYLSCVSARDAALGISTNVDRFEADGACWGSPPGAELCDTACVRGLDYLASLENAPAECAP